MANERRFTVVLPQELHKKLTTTVPTGLRKHLVIALLGAAMDMADKFGPDVTIGVLISGRYYIEPYPAAGGEASHEGPAR